MVGADIINFIEGNVNYYAASAPHVKEQAALRAMLCHECASLGKCKVCSCKTPQMFYSPSKVDSEGKWAEFLSARQWESLKANIEEYYRFIKNLGND